VIPNLPNTYSKHYEIQLFSFPPSYPSLNLRIDIYLLHIIKKPALTAPIRQNDVYECIDNVINDRSQYCCCCPQPQTGASFDEADV
jgi:hypothetical protein